MVFLGAWLAAFRATRVITKDSLFKRQREWFFRWYPPNEEWAKLRPSRLDDGTRSWIQDPAPRRRISKWGQLIECPFCSGFYVSGLTVLLLQHWVSVKFPVMWWLAISAAVGLAAKNLDT
jgi:hypothetical protein